MFIKLYNSNLNVKIINSAFIFKYFLFILMFKNLIIK